MADPDQRAFEVAFERHRAELQVHCYRMLGSLDESEDQVQETFLRAWRNRASFTSDGRSALRAWLYRIATNACLDVLRTRPRRVIPQEAGPASDARAAPAPAVDLPWLQPYPDRLLESIAVPEDQPDAAVVAKETIELAFLAAIQHLPPRQRAVFILRDVVGWSARDTASLMEATVVSVNSALQRARATLQDRLPGERTEWGPARGPSKEERELLRRYVAAHDEADADAIAAMLREDADLTMPPLPTWYQGREEVMIAVRKGFDPEFGRLRSIATAANMQAAAAHYHRPPGDSEYQALALDVLRIEDGLIAEIDSFVLPALFSAFGLPPAL